VNTASQEEDARTSCMIRGPFVRAK
jgi:hypothetical protein